MFLYGLLSTIYYLWIGGVQTSSLNLDVANINIKFKYNIVEVSLTRIPIFFKRPILRPIYCLCSKVDTNPTLV